MSVSGAKLNSNVLREVVHPLTDQAHDYDAVLSLVGNAALCLLGEVVLDFVEWLREHNASLPLTAPKVGFYLNTRYAT